MMIRNRYSIEDSVCEISETASTKIRALELAENHVRIHDIAGDHDLKFPHYGVIVTVVDNMALRSQPRRWQPDGRIVGWRVAEEDEAL